METQKLLRFIADGDMRCGKSIRALTCEVVPNPVDKDLLASHNFSILSTKFRRWFWRIILYHKLVHRSSYLTCCMFSILVLEAGWFGAIKIYNPWMEAKRAEEGSTFCSPYPFLGTIYFVMEVVWANGIKIFVPSNLKPPLERWDVRNKSRTTK